MPDAAATPAVKPGWKTTEFWLTTAAMLAGAVAAFLPSAGRGGQIAGLVVLVLAKLGYTAQRGYLKAAAPGDTATSIAEAVLPVLAQASPVLAAALEAGKSAAAPAAPVQTTKTPSSSEA